MTETLRKKIDSALDALDGLTEALEQFDHAVSALKGALTKGIDYKEETE